MGSIKAKRGRHILPGPDLWRFASHKSVVSPTLWLFDHGPVIEARTPDRSHAQRGRRNSSRPTPTILQAGRDLGLARSPGKRRFPRASTRIGLGLREGDQVQCHNLPRTVAAHRQPKRQALRRWHALKPLDVRLLRTSALGRPISHHAKRPLIALRVRLSPTSHKAPSQHREAAREPWMTRKAPLHSLRRTSGTPLRLRPGRWPNWQSGIPVSALAQIDSSASSRCRLPSRGTRLAPARSAG
ncbi:hypothetical protein PMNALOAF_2382 [Methylobacterium adhaesivum]|nr:hypothetical protein PMNALOAF_2382 [Methylobacterium adhaesivum]